VAVLKLTEAGKAAARYPYKPGKVTRWCREPKGPGRAVHMFRDAHGERVELLAFDSHPPSGARMAGFDIHAQDYRGEYRRRVVAGEAATLEDVMKAAVLMVSCLRDQWQILPRSSGKN
jgi:hypothetical protein